MLQRRLEAAVQAEEYEEAAQIRDKIAQISEETK
jgi:protein-arginine kinase activator protein McsA